MRRFDLFISLSGDDRAAVAPLIKALNGAGLVTFVDDREIERHAGLSDSIRSAIADSAAMLAYYSRTYATRPACQWELIAAFSAARPAGEVAERILVVNREQDEKHLHDLDTRRCPSGGAAAATKAVERIAWSMLTRRGAGRRSAT